LRNIKNQSEMKKILLFLTLPMLSASLCQAQQPDSWIRINQLGYLPGDVKVAVYISETAAVPQEFSIIDVFTGDTAFVSRSISVEKGYGKMKTACRLDFSGFRKLGAYRIAAREALSPIFPIDPCTYDGTTDYLLRYMRQQRCGFNPYLRDSCHTKDGYIVWSGDPKQDSTWIDVTGGWHDAGDCLQYTTTSANSIYLMTLANEDSRDDYQANGLPGHNGIPDIVDEIKWGLDWMVKMNPEDSVMYNQIADDRDHIGMRLPHDDTADYGWGPNNGRPVYRVTGKPQQRGKHGGMNISTGAASIAGKFASDFAFGASAVRKYYPEFADMIAKKAVSAYEYGRAHPGFSQTASVVSPYIYEESDWADDMELAAVSLWKLTGDSKYLAQAIEYGKMQPLKPWIGADTARHYQWYPFANLAHSYIDDFRPYRHEALDLIARKSADDAFRHGIPYVWCSNNFSAAALDQMLAFGSSDKQLEASFRDWLFGCNPWGTSMIVGLPAYGDYPDQPHSSLLYCGVGRPDGGLVDGPVYSTIFNSLEGVRVDGGNDYAEFQPDRMVYHDSMHDYSTNEPTLDGTAAVFYPLAVFQNEGRLQRTVFNATKNPFFDGASIDRNVYEDGAIVKSDTTKKHITLIFTAADKHDGESKILKVLKKEHIRGYFFFTGEFYEKFPETVQHIRREGHYVGSHSYGHLLYMPWEDRDSMLVTREQFDQDMFKSYKLIREAGIDDSLKLFVPPYEYYNENISSWARQIGLHLINYTPGSGTNGDYTTPDMDSYKSSKQIYDRLMKLEKKQRNGLNGYILLIHFGTDDARTDKFYDRYLEKTIRELKHRGYTF